MSHDAARLFQCHLSPAPGLHLSGALVRETFRSVPNFLVSLLIAFFPKCAMCWATYMSMLGSVWLARAPYLAWLFPALLALSGLNLLLLLRKARRKGYGPFLLGLAGIAVILGGRSQFPAERWLLLLGMSLMFSSSLLGSFSTGPRPSVSTTTRKQGHP